MNATIRLAFLPLAAVCACALAQYPPAYPAKGQTQQKQATDSSECRAWAQQTTGIDPAVASQPAPQQTGPAVGGGQRARGAVRGAAAGAVIGEAGSGDSSHGAKVGAAAGVVAGGSRARQERRSQNAAAQQNQQNAMATFNNAWGTCMKGRGYTVG
ncbi:MAG TPA: glycine zipper family protein [Rhodanobacteraceae bacterium]|nr:glycine zipper family protein [Rhodanobacteraceae bacterium]